MMLHISNNSERKEREKLSLLSHEIKAKANTLATNS